MILKSTKLFMLLFLIFFGNLASGQVKADDYFSHTVTIHQENDVIVASVIPCKVNKPLVDRNYYWLSGNRINKTQGGFSGKLLNGAYKAFYEHKNLKESGSYRNGLQSGLWKYWNQDGVLLRTVHFADGFKQGLETIYDSIGNVNEQRMYNEGKYHGKLLKLNGDSIVTEKYKNGVMQIPAPVKKKKFLFF